MDLFSSDPGSTAGGGRPDEANVGFAAENDPRDLEGPVERRSSVRVAPI
jgi:hypothetical protein